MKQRIRAYSIEYYEYLIHYSNSFGGLVFYHMKIEMLRGKS